MASRYPGKDGVNTATPLEFWDTLLKGEDIRTTPPNERWGTNIPASQPMRGTYISGADLFEPEKFGLSEVEAVDMDAQQRLSIEVAAECLANAGYLDDKGKAKAGKDDVGVYVGIALAEGLTTCMQVGKTDFVGQSKDNLIHFTFSTFLVRGLALHSRRQPARGYSQPRFLLSGPQGAVSDGRHHVLKLPLLGPPGLQRSSSTGLLARSRWRCQHHSQPCLVHHAGQARCFVARVRAPCL
jgi:hypothetical protein